MSLQWWKRSPYDDDVLGQDFAAVAVRALFHDIVVVVVADVVAGGIFVQVFF